MAAFRTDRNDRSSVDRRVRGDRLCWQARARAEQYRLLRGYAPTNFTDQLLLPVSYWFVNPEKHLGDQLNYRDRIRGATGIVLPNGSIIFDARRNRAVPLVDQARYLTILRSASTIGS